ncbi:Nucleotide excision repair factor NEF2, RAD23 component [Phaffia rhodozyma]|uniref:UV excision repair protein RAD23 n=1 Tax=Phaffia rhodozyma TaxID=264483 RepID=A0A0F7SH83_PHARH|nr:Nucleotide excision repair factor NEF2, RAD23 component [Phaffia rhodozyma]
MSRTVTFKTLDQKSFTVSVNDDDSISTVKEKVNALGKPVSKLIYSGKVLDDSKTVAEIDIKEKDFVVVMFAKVKPAPKAAEPTASVATPSATAASPAPPTTDTTSAPASDAPSSDVSMSEPAAPAATPASSGLASTGLSHGSFLKGDALQSAIANMKEMGFEEALIMRALKASFNNPDRAVEYLMNGIPEESEQPTSVASIAPSAPAAAVPASAGAVTDDSAPTSAPAPSSGGEPENLFAAAAAAMQQQPGGARSGASAAPQGAQGAGAGQLDLSALAQTPMMQQLRQMVRENPALIQPMIQQLVQSNPALGQQIAANPEIIMQLFAGEDGGEFGEDDGEWEGGDELMAALGGERGEGGDHQNVVQVTEQERDAIERLESMGFPRNKVLEAFLLCDRDEEMAANYLFDTAGDDDI